MTTSSEMLARGLARAVSRELRSTKVTSRVAPFAFGAAGMTTTTTASTTLCVLTHEKLVDSRPIAERLRAETPSAFDIVVGSRVEDFDDAISGAGEARDVALLWWFAPRALAEGVMTAAARAERSERVRWMHSGSAGVEHLLAIPSVKAHSSVMTNARGAFSGLDRESDPKATCLCDITHLLLPRFRCLVVVQINDGDGCQGPDGKATCGS